MGLDVGEESIATFSTVIEQAATIVWNGPVGVFEFEKFAVGSKTVLETIVIATDKGATSIVGEIYHNNTFLCMWKNYIIIWIGQNGFYMYVYA